MGKIWMEIVILFAKFNFNIANNKNKFNNNNK